MKDLEKILASAERTAPGKDLDRRLEQLLAAAPRHGAWGRPVALWQAAAALALVAVAAFAGGRWSAEDSEALPRGATSTVYIIQGNPTEAYDTSRGSTGFLSSPEDVRIRIIQPDPHPVPGAI